MEVGENCYFYSQSTIQPIADNGESVLSLARKIYYLHRPKDGLHDDDSRPKSFASDLEPFEIESTKTSTPPPAFTSSWNPDEQPLKYKFDRFRWESVRLINELSAYLYGYQWTSPLGGCAAKLHQHTINFLHFEYSELIEGCSVVYNRWQSQKFHQKYLHASLKLNINEQDTSLTGTARGGFSGTGGSSSGLLHAQPGLKNSFRSRLGSATSLTKSERSTTTGTSHGDPQMPKSKGKRKASITAENAPSLHQSGRKTKNDNENRMASKADRHLVPRTQFVWSATVRQREREAAAECDEPFFTKSTHAVISVDSIPSQENQTRKSAKSLPVPSPHDIIQSHKHLKRVMELFEELARKRQSENKRWLETGRIYACRVICYGDRRTAMMSRSKSAVIPSNVSASTPAAPLSAALPKSAKGPRTSVAQLNWPTKASAETTRSAFALVSSFIGCSHRKGFHLNDAYQGRIPQSNLDSPAYKRNIFVTTLPDGSYSALLVILDQGRTREGQVFVFTFSYPNRKPAVVQSCYFSKSLPLPSHNTTLAYDHTAVGDIILVATPLSLFAYAPKTEKRLFADEKGITIITAEIKVDSYPKWKFKGPQGISFEMNDYMTLSIHAVDRISLTFQNQTTAESFKFAIGLKFDQPVPAPDNKYIQTNDIEFQSQSAYDMFKPVGKSKGSTSHHHQSRGQRNISKSEQLAKKLGFIDNSYIMDASAHLKRLKNKISWTCESWLSHYSLWLGITEVRGLSIEKPASRLFHRRSARRMARSAGLPLQHSQSDDEHVLEALDSSLSEDGSVKRRKGRRPTSMDAKAIEALASARGTPPPEAGAVLKDKFSRNSSAARTDSTKPERVKSGLRPTSPTRSMTPPLTEVPLKLPPNSGLTEFHLVGVCPVALRRHMTGGIDASIPQTKFCHCSRQKAPVITDVELDLFLTKFAPQNQIIVVQIVNSQISHSFKCGIAPTTVDEFECAIDELYGALSLYRPRPCVDSISDRFRLVRYDLGAAATGAFVHAPPSELLPSTSVRRVPLLIRRHNVRRGMTLMYHGGGLVSCGFISPTTSDALLRQVEQSWRLALRAFSLPPDFRINVSESTVYRNGTTTRRTDAFVAKYLPKTREPTSEDTTRDKGQSVEVANNGMLGVFLARDHHSSRDFPCLHLPTT